MQFIVHKTHHYFYNCTLWFLQLLCWPLICKNWKITYSYAGVSAPCKGKFNPGQPVQYWLDNVMCVGNEESLFDCPRRGRARTIGIHNCRRRERAGVRCLSMFTSPLCVTYLSVCCVSDESDVGIRLIRNDKDTRNNMSGIIELSIRGEWRSVCDQHWSNVDAQVACRQLGLPYTSKQE